MSVLSTYYSEDKSVMAVVTKLFGSNPYVVKVIGEDKAYSETFSTEDDAEQFAEDAIS